MAKKRRKKGRAAPDGVLVPVVVRGVQVGTVRAAAQPPVWPWVRFAKLADLGIGLGDMQGLAVLYDVLQAAVDPADWPRCSALFDQHQPPTDDLLGFVVAALQAHTGRPTGRPSDTSGGSQTSGRTSEDGSSSPGTARPEDLAELVDIEEYQRTRSA